jgi:hypothetical protein
MPEAAHIGSARLVCLVVSLISMPQSIAMVAAASASSWSPEAQSALSPIPRSGRCIRIRERRLDGVSREYPSGPPRYYRCLISAPYTAEGGLDVFFIPSRLRSTSRQSLRHSRLRPCELHLTIAFQLAFQLRQVLPRQSTGGFWSRHGEPRILAPAWFEQV